MKNQNDQSKQKGFHSRSISFWGIPDASEIDKMKFGGLLKGRCQTSS